MDYKEMYFEMSGKLADAIDMLEKIADELKTMQLEAENKFIENPNY